MFLQNYYNLINAVNASTGNTFASSSNGSYYFNYTPSGEVYIMTKPNGTRVNIGNSSIGDMACSRSMVFEAARLFTTDNPTSTSPPYIAIVFGSGTTPPTINDYKIESVISTLSCPTPTVVGSYDENNFYYRTAYALTNTGNESVTINEYAYYVYNGTGFACVYREVLQQPLTIGAGETGTINITRSVPKIFAS